MAEGDRRSVFSLARRAVMFELRLYRSLYRWVTRRPVVPSPDVEAVGYSRAVTPVMLLWIFASGSRDGRRPPDRSVADRPDRPARRVRLGSDLDGRVLGQPEGVSAPVERRFTARSARRHRRHRYPMDRDRLDHEPASARCVVDPDRSAQRGQERWDGFADRGVGKANVHARSPARVDCADAEGRPGDRRAQLPGRRPQGIRRPGTAAPDCRRHAAGWMTTSSARRSEMQTKVIHNPEEHQYEIWADDELAGFAQYHPYQGALAFIHTEIDDRFEGKGLGSTLVRSA